MKEKSPYSEGLNDLNKTSSLILSFETLTLQKLRVLQIQDVHGVRLYLRYAEPLATQEMQCHRLSRRVNNVTVFLGFLDITHGGLHDMA